MNFRSTIGEERYAALTPKDRAELDRLQSEIDATIEHIQATHTAFTPAPEAPVK